MAQTFGEYLALYSNLIWVLCGVTLVGATSAYMGVYAVLRRESLSGDTLSHALLPGICAGFVLSTGSNFQAVLLGATLSGALALAALWAIKRFSFLPGESAQALVLSTFFAAGLLWLTHLQQQGVEGVSALRHFLFGQAAAITAADLPGYALVSGVVVALISLHSRLLATHAFDPVFFGVRGFSQAHVNRVAAIALLLAVALGVQAVGVVLISALLVTPAAVARLWTHRLPVMSRLAVALGIVGAWAGTWISFSMANMPTGPWVVLVMAGVLLASFALRPGEGILIRRIKRHALRKRMERENMLKAFFHHAERNHSNQVPVAYLCQLFDASSLAVENKLNALHKKGWVHPSKTGFWELTASGQQLASALVRRHRLYELYLSRRLNLPGDHVHQTADAMEHLLTPELEALLTAELGPAERDPHNRKIPPP